MVIIAERNGNIDSSFHTLVKHIDSPLTIVMVSWAENFLFNESLNGIKDYVLVDYCEYGWDSNLTETHLWGVNSEKFPRYYNGDWVKFDNFVKQNPPKLFFKRELLQKDVSEIIRPIDYTTDIPPLPAQSESQFNSRPISACYYFGRSHEGRLLIHSDIWKGATKYGYSVNDNIYYFNDFMHHERGKKYVSMNIPHYSRHPISEILKINGCSKIGIVPHGAGIKTFRASEVSVNSVMLMWDDNLAWAHDWVHGVNCLKCNQGEEVETIEKWANDKNLYSIYLEGVKTWNKYRTTNYIKNYIEPILNEVA